MKVAFFKGTHPGVKGWLGIATKWWTVGAYSHCELVVNELADGSVECWSSAYLDGGVRKTTLTLDAADWDVIDVPTTPAEEAAAIAWFEAHAGQPYDVLGLFHFVWSPEEGDKAKWFCSESVAAALGYDEAWRYDPNLFAAVLRRDAQEASGALSAV